MRLIRIDEAHRPNHPYLTPSDVCYFWGEYTARAGYQHSDTNQLVMNFKKPVSKKNQPDWTYKQQATLTLADILANAIDKKFLQHVTFVPVPPSKTKDDPKHDDRMIELLRQLENNIGIELDVRELIKQTKSMPAAHEQEDGQRPKPEVLRACYLLEQDLLTPTPKQLVVIDDLLTTGCHFKAVQMVLGEAFPGVPISELFVARRSITITT